MSDDGGVDRNATIWADYVTPLIEAGFTYGDAEWLLSEVTFFRGSPEGFTAAAVAYRAAGFTAQEASHWHNLVGHLDVAVELANAGWTPAQYETLWTVVQAQAWAGYLPSKRRHQDRIYAELDAWVATGLPPALAIQFAAARIEPDEAVALTAHAASVHGLARQLSLLAALHT